MVGEKEMEPDEEVTDGAWVRVDGETFSLTKAPRVDLEMPPDAPAIPRLVLDAGPAAVYAYETFFYARHSPKKSPHTHRAYLFTVRRFLEVAETQGLTLRTIRPLHVSSYLDQYPGELVTKNRQLSALRKFFAELVTYHVLPLNPAATVSGFKQSVDEGGGKSPEITAKQQDRLLSSIDTGSLVGLRDYVVLATMICTAARRGAVARLDVHDLFHEAGTWVFRFREKGSRVRLIPVRHDLELLLMEYRRRSGIESESAPAKPTEMGEERARWPFFRSALARTDTLTEKRMTGEDIGAMLKRRLRAAGLPHTLVPHSFRVATLTDLFRQKVAEHEIQYLAGHADRRTTDLYNRTKRKVTRNLVERISVKLKGPADSIDTDSDPRS